MTPKQWELLKKIFNQAIELPENQQQQFLEQNCKGDPDLENELALMIAQTKRDGSNLTELIESSADQLLFHSNLEGKRVGSFELQQRIGVGGMGEVYKAKRIDGEFEQLVAMKIIRPGFFNEKLNLRFQLERQILARLNHPNIARVIDGGRFDDDQLYLAMEYIDGVPIDEYCKQHSLSETDKLALFNKVCKAVLSAHQNRIIHCDLKPSNILVSSDGEPHLLDFGIATFEQAADDKQQAHASHSGINAISWNYASPEQQSGQLLTTATDIYALGVLLCELLLDEKINVSSHKVTQEFINKIANQDLRLVISKSLQPEAENRYLSTDKLIDDLARIPKKLPISLRLHDKKYLFFSFLQRNRLPAAVASFAFVMLIGFSIREFQLREVAELATIEAQQSQLKSQQVTDFLIDIFKVSDPDNAKGKSISAREILENGRARVTQDLEKQPETAVELLRTIALVYENLGLYGDAFQTYQQALEVAKAKLPNQLLPQLAILSRLGFVNIHLSDFSAAESYLTQAVNINLAPTTIEHASTFNHLGLLNHERANFEEAITYYKKAINIKQKAEPKGRISYVRIQLNLADSLVRLGHYKQAENLLVEILDVKEKAHGKNNQFYIRTLLSYVNLVTYAGDNENSLALAQELIDLAKNIFDENHPVYIDGMDTLAYALTKKGLYRQAEQYYLKLQALDLKNSGEESVSYSYTLNNLAFFYMDMENYAKAEPLFVQSLALRQKLYDKTHPRIFAAQNNIAKLYHQKGQAAEAIAVQQKVYAAIDKDYKPNIHSKMALLISMADYYVANNQLPESIEFTNTVKPLLKDNIDANHKLYGQFYAVKAKQSAKNGDVKHAISEFKKTLSINKAIYGDKHPELAKHKIQLADWLFRENQLDKAKLIIEQNLPYLEANLVEGAPSIATALALLNKIEQAKLQQSN